MKQVKVIGAISCWGAPDTGCAAGPVALRGQILGARFAEAGAAVEWCEIRSPATGKPGDLLDRVVKTCRQVHEAVAGGLRSGRFPLILGGDHSCAVGTWSAVRSFAVGPIGLVWIDAHMDSHTPQTSHTGAVHGMPLAALLGYGDARLTQLGGQEPKLLPRHVALVGVRSYEPEEAALLERLQVRVFFMDEVRRRGLDAVLREARDIATDGTTGYGVSIDLDAVDPRDAPGVGSPAPDGIRGETLVTGLQALHSDAALLGLEIVEYNPSRDIDARTARLVESLVHAVVG